MYKIDPPGPGDQLAVHFSYDGSTLHIVRIILFHILTGFTLLQDSEEAKMQEAYKERRKEEEEETRKLAAKIAAEAGEGDDIEEEEGGKNQFNYSERAAQTFNNPLRERGVATEPPPVVQFKSTVTQWDIYDTYMCEYQNLLAEQEMLKNADKKKSGNYALIYTSSTISTKNQEVTKRRLRNRQPTLRVSETTWSMASKCQTPSRSSNEW